MSRYTNPYSVSNTLRNIFPNSVVQKVRDVIARPPFGEGIAEMWNRREEFTSPAAAVLAGIAVHEPSRLEFDAALDDYWRRTRLRRNTQAADKRYGEVVIGAGLHAAIYCAARVKAGHPKPLVVEGSSGVGGVFATSRKPAFYLNSRNRPGPLSVPGSGNGSLNVLPGSLIQPADLSGDEYQINSDLAYAIRTTLAMYANVVTGFKCEDVRYAAKGSRMSRDATYDKLRLNHIYDFGVTLRDSKGARVMLYAERVIIATGIGKERVFPGTENMERVMGYGDFMRKMDAPFPLRGMDRVAVIGGGDSGKTVIEAINGQGPSRGSSVMGLDWPNVIDWYGVGDEDECLYRRGWDRTARSRYKGIARLLPIDYEVPNDRAARVMPYIDRANTISEGYECVFVNGRPYDYVVVCMGWEAQEFPGFAYSPYKLKGLELGRFANPYPCFQIGPVAALEVTSEEKNASPATRQIPENSTSIYRYAGRTAQLAQVLPSVSY